VRPLLKLGFLWPLFLTPCMITVQKILVVHTVGDTESHLAIADVPK